MPNPIELGLGLVAIIGVAAGSIIAAWFLRVGPQASAGLWGPQPPESWPHGVQEDDDVRWDWHPLVRVGPRLEESSVAILTVPVHGQTLRR